MLRRAGRLGNIVAVPDDGGVFEKHAVPRIRNHLRLSVAADIQPHGRIKENTSFLGGIARSHVGQGMAFKLDFTHILDCVIRHIQFRGHLIEFRMTWYLDAIEKVFAKVPVPQGNERSKMARTWIWDIRGRKIDAPASVHSLQQACKVAQEHHR